MFGSNLKNRVGLLRALLATVLLSLGMPSLSVASEDKVLNIYNWSDYIGDNTIKNFEKETGIKVRYDTFDSNETLHAKLVAGKTGYDIVVPSSNWAKIQLEGGLLMKLDKSKITTYGNLDPFVMKKLATIDPGNQYLAPWLWGITTVGINVNKVKAALGNLPMPDNAWDLLFKPEYVSKLKSCGVSMLDSGDEIFPAALRYLGKQPYSHNPSDYQEASSAACEDSSFSHTVFIIRLHQRSGQRISMRVTRLEWRHEYRATDAPRKQRTVSISRCCCRRPVPYCSSTRWRSQPMPRTRKTPTSGSATFIVRMSTPVWSTRFSTPTRYRARPSTSNPKSVADKTVFMKPGDLARMVPPDMVPIDIRRLRTRLYTTFKTGI